MSLNINSQKKFRKMKAKWHIDSWEDYEKMENEIMSKIAREKEIGKNTKVRIIAGKAKHHTLNVPKRTRPLTDRLKTTIFDVLGTDILKKDVLDLYAGSGSFGLEALSRGANSATFVDTAKQANYIINENAEKTGLTSQSNIIKEKVEDFVSNKNNLETTYDIIFIDPPYKKFTNKNFEEIENIINSAKNMLPGFKTDNKKKFKGTILLKHPRKYPLGKLELNSLKAIETYNFGLNSITIYIVI